MKMRMILNEIIRQSDLDLIQVNRKPEFDQANWPGTKAAERFIAWPGQGVAIKRNVRHGRSPV